jgi:hypothetical protein
MNNKYIYLVFTKTGTWLSRLISTFSDIRYPHASLSFDSDFTKMYSFGRTNPSNPFSGGFVEESLYGGVFSRFSYSECMILRVTITEEQYSLLQKHVEEFLKEKSKYKYNFLGLSAILLNKSIKRKNYYFCSQFISEALIKSNVLELNKDPELTRTDDLYSIKNKELIYEGYVNARFPFPAFTQI